uniref:NADH-ubiquinone oxidoreductase chain 4 n=1 Tax=Aegista aubryana TaxID=1789663 RepID=A0A0Y0JF59_9EUPU|nr:NADH dehydrogenase subunit 4 [Aegista aubryana]AMB49890.1 NADH dehydrogenase subunit 4 [Aegista aubryana]
MIWGELHSFLLVFLSGLIALMLNIHYIEVMIFLTFCIPFSMIMLYKTSVYLEDLIFCMNDMNGMLIFMTLSLALLIFLSSWAITSMLYSFLQLALLFILLLCFSLNNLFMFYIFFESSLVPILLMIIGWGYQPERLQAGLYMIMYTVMGSMFLFVIIMYMYHYTNTLNMFFLFNFSCFSATIFWVGIIAFLVKLPMWSLHVWLPKAHVEAPLGGSMILAGALLKLGGYGLYMFSAFMNTSITGTVPVTVITLAMWGGLISALLCLGQSDIKAMIAYSSIVHMALVIMGCLSGTSWGQLCALTTMVAHGWASSALFCVAFMSYEKVNSRSFILTKGLLKLYPILSMLWFMLVLINMAVPPTINLVGELLAVPVCMWINPFILFVLLLIMFLSVTYNMYLYVEINHGSAGSFLLSGQSTTAVGSLALLGHMFPLMLILNMNFLVG